MNDKQDNSHYNEEKLTNDQEAILLEQIERSEKSPQDFDFIDFVKHKNTWTLYGPPNSKRRTLYRYRLKYWRGLTPTKYADLLDCRRVRRSNITFQRLIDESAKEISALTVTTPPIKSPTVESKDDDKAKKPEPPPQEQEDDNDADNISTSTDYSSTSTTMSDYFQSPPKKSSYSKWDASHAAVPDFASPSREGSSSMAFTPTKSAINQSTAKSKYEDYLKWHAPVPGTKEEPFVIYVDPTNPQSSREFDVSLIPMKLVKGFRRNCIHIRVCAAPGDHKEYSMMIPEDTVGMVLIRGPTRCIAYKDVQQYHRKGKNGKGVNCVVTKKIHKEQYKEVLPPYSYWLLIFPEGLCFDNLIFSDDQVEVKANYNGICIGDNVTGITDKPFNAMFVYWEIAEAKAGIKMDDEDEEDL
jgi:hypothetical protein